MDRTCCDLCIILLAIHQILAMTDKLSSSPRGFLFFLKQQIMSPDEDMKDTVNYVLLFIKFVIILILSYLAGDILSEYTTKINPFMMKIFVFCIFTWLFHFVEGFIIAYSIYIKRIDLDMDKQKKSFGEYIDFVYGGFERTDYGGYCILIQVSTFIIGLTVAFCTVYSCIVIDNVFIYLMKTMIFICACFMFLAFYYSCKTIYRKFVEKANQITTN